MYNTWTNKNRSKQGKYMNKTKTKVTGPIFYFYSRAYCTDIPPASTPSVTPIARSLMQWGKCILYVFDLHVVAWSCGIRLLNHCTGLTTSIQTLHSHIFGYKHKVRHCAISFQSVSWQLLKLESSNMASCFTSVRAELCSVMKDPVWFNFSYMCQKLFVFNGLILCCFTDMQLWACETYPMIVNNMYHWWPHIIIYFICHPIVHVCM